MPFISRRRRRPRSPWAPAVWLAFLSYDGGLGARPVTEAIRVSGDWALRLLWLVLLIGPARRILATAAPGSRPPDSRRRRVRSRRAALRPLCLRPAVRLGRGGSETVLRLYLTTGAVALIGLAALAATSSDRAVARIGSTRWNRLHSAIYVIAALSVLHFLLRSRTETFEPMLMLGLLVWLIGYRAVHRLVGDVHPARVARPRWRRAPSLTATAEAAWHAAATGVDPLRLLAAHFDRRTDCGRPAGCCSPDLRRRPRPLRAGGTSLSRRWRERSLRMPPPESARGQSPS